MIDRRGRLEPLPAIGEGIRRDIDDAHHQSSTWLRQAGYGWQRIHADHPMLSFRAASAERLFAAPARCVAERVAAPLRGGKGSAGSRRSGLAGFGIGSRNTLRLSRDRWRDTRDRAAETRPIRASRTCCEPHCGRPAVRTCCDGEVWPRPNDQSGQHIAEEEQHLCRRPWCRPDHLHRQGAFAETTAARFQAGRRTGRSWSAA